MTTNTRRTTQREAQQRATARFLLNVIEAKRKRNKKEGR